MFDFALIQNFSFMMKITISGVEQKKNSATDYYAEDAILYPSCFDANAGLFEAILDEKDVVISDALNHASIIDGIRLCKAKRWGGAI